MATVRFSQEFKDAIIKNANAVFEKQVVKAREATNPSWADRVYYIAFEQYAPQLNAVPPEFLRFEDNFDIKCNYEAGRSVSFNVKLTTPRIFPRNGIPSGAPISATSSYSLAYEINREHYNEIIEEIATWQRGINEAVARQQEFVKQVKQIIEAHATLAPALKMWPALWDLIPEEYKNKHREIKVREKKEVEVDVNLGALTAAVTFNKITR